MRTSATKKPLSLLAALLQVVLLAAFARVLAELDTVEESVVQQCLHVIERLVQAYRGLWPKQRLPVHAALNILLLALQPKQAVLHSMLPRLVSIMLTYTLKPADNNLIAGGVCCLCWSFLEQVCALLHHSTFSKAVARTDTALILTECHQREWTNDT